MFRNVRCSKMYLSTQLSCNCEKKKPQNNIIKTAEKINSIKELENKNFITNEIKQDVYKRDDFVFLFCRVIKVKTLCS